MKIEKLNEQQIRCTLTKEDLADRHIKLSELAYGTEKTRALFQDMMEQASRDFDFEVDNIPLMVEAIPMSSEQIVLIITKVESPDELDTRFSEFSHFLEEDDEEEDGGDFSTELDLPEDLLELLREIRHELTEAGECPEEIGEQAKETEEAFLVAFSDMEEVIPAARAVAPGFRGSSVLYRDGESGDYLLFLHRDQHTPMEFNRICHTLAAYIRGRRCVPGMEARCREHGRVILAERAVQILTEI